MKILLIRHGETTGDVEDRWGGSYDDHLTQKGREQLKETAQRVGDKQIEIIFHSPLIRAKEAAEIIQDEIGCAIRSFRGLEERHYGVLTGLTKKEAEEKYPEAVEAHKDPMNTDPEGESFEDFNQRVVEAFEKIRIEPYETIAIVAHGGSLKRILSHINAPIPDSIGDGGIVEVEVS
jgi:broad specificity phosphatase PhoE